MPNLKNNEFQIINDILFELYGINDLKELEERFLTNIRTLVPCNQSNFRAIDPYTGSVLKDGTVFIDTDRDMIPVFFANIVPEKNYLKNLFNYKESVVYLESDLLDDHIRHNTEFYKSFLEPQGIPYSCGIVLIYESNLIGVISIFRSEELGDFTEKELFILELFKLHLSRLTMACILNKKNYIKIDNSDLTLREAEIAELIFRGYTNEEIAKELCISMSTTKKHINHIFNKYNVSNRMSLIKILRSK